MPFLDPHPSVLNQIRNFHPGLTVVYNPDWMTFKDGGPAPNWRFMVCQMIFELEDIEPGAGIFVVRRKPFPVLGIPQASEIDNRFIQQLDANRTRTAVKKIRKHFREKKVKDREAFVDHMGDWAKEKGHYLWGKEHSDLRMSHIPKADKPNPADDYKRRQDKLGRDLR